MIPRRMFLRTFGVGALLAPSASYAQPRPKVPVIGVLLNGSAASYAKEVEAFRAGLRDLGYAEGRNIAIEYRWTDGKFDRIPDLAADLARLNVDAIVTYSGTVIRAVMRATTTIPIVIAAAGDPIASGLVTNLARPEGNVTGSTFFAGELAAKRLDLLKEAFPRLQRVALLVNPDTRAARLIVLPSLEPAARALKVEVQQFAARNANELEQAFSAMESQRVDGVVINEDSTLNALASAIGTLASKQRFPSIGFKQVAEAGGLMGYGADIPAMFRRAAYFVDRILRGARPGDLPIERATTFEMVINLKTAKALGLTVPPAMLLRASRVIEP